MYIGLHVSFRCYCHILMKLEISLQIFEEYSNINITTIGPVGPQLFHADGRMDGRTDMMTLTVAL